MADYELIPIDEGSPRIRPTLKNPSPEGDHVVYDPTGTVSSLPTKPQGRTTASADYELVPVENTPVTQKQVIPVKQEPSISASALRTASGLAHTVRAMAETGAGVATGLAAFPISKGTKWIEYGLSGGDLEKAKAAEQRANERIQFNPTTTEAQGALDKIGKVIDPVFKTLREAGRIPGESMNSPTIMELGGDVAEIVGPIKAHGMLKTQRAYRSAKPVVEIREPKTPEAITEPIKKPVQKPTTVEAKNYVLEEVKADTPLKKPKIIEAKNYVL
jgi:hypothetical protein